jgi:signal peptidase II
LTADTQKQNWHFKIIIAIVFVVLILDQITKYSAKIFLAPRQSVSVLGNFFRLTFVENPGIAFGIRVNNKVFFTILSLMAVVVIFYYLFKLKDHLLLRVAFAIILGGAFGNLIDRFIYGKVIDFLDFDFFNVNLPSFKFLLFEFQGYTMERWPVFNLADSAVSIGMMLILLSTFLEKRNL